MSNDVYWAVFRFLLTIAAIAGPAWAQFADLATTDDGRDLYFATTLTLGEPAITTRAELRIYRIGPDGLAVFAARGSLAPAQSFGSGDGAALPQVSGDGKTVGFTLRGVCLEGDPCIRAVTAAQVRGVGTLGEGTLELSRNGRWALLRAQPSPFSEGTAALIDLTTGARTQLPAPASDSFALASDGSVLVREGIWKQGQVTPLVLLGSVRPVALSDDARLILYFRAPELSLWARNITMGGDTRLSPGLAAGELPILMGMTSDARYVLYRVGVRRREGQAFLADTVTGAREPVPLREGELASAGTLSGSGNAVFVATTAGRIVRYAVSAGVPREAQELVPATPYVTGLEYVAPGSLVRLRRGFAATSDELAGKLVVDGRAMPVLYAPPDEIWVQVPWEQSTGDALFRLEVPSVSPFRQFETVFIAPQAPRFEAADPGAAGIFPLKLIKGDFSGLVTEPPQPGDIVHMYMTGLGAVRGPVETGVPAPVGSVLPAVAEVKCRFLPHTTEAETLFAGLAPGMIGVYQVSFRMPADAGARLTGMQCRIGGAGLLIGVVGGS